MAIDTSTIDRYAVFAKYLVLGRRVATTHGGEYATACPFCKAGKDRFRVWPDRTDSNIVYWCRVCDCKGDIISFVQEVEGVSFLEACQILQVASNFQSSPKRQQTNKEAPSDAWQGVAIAFALDCQKTLWSDTGKNALAWLRQRGFTDTTIKKAGLGYNPTTHVDELSAWHITNPEKKAVWIPRGITIPWQVDNQLWKVNIRRPNPDIERDRANGKDKPPKYIPILGSCTGLYGVDRFHAERPTILVEGEFDKLILSQEIADINAVATGSTQHARSERWVLTVAQSSTILIAYDVDNKKQGENATDYWLRAIPHAIMWQPYAHDVNEMFLEKHDLQTWVTIGIKTAIMLNAEKEEQKLSLSPSDCVVEKGYTLTEHMKRVQETTNGKPIKPCRFCSTETKPVIQWAWSALDSDWMCLKCLSPMSKPVVLY